MEFLASLPRFNKDLPAKTTFDWFERAVGNREGICYYKYPIVGIAGTPDLVFLFRELHPIVVKCYDLALDGIMGVRDGAWWIRMGIDEVEIDSPCL